MKLLKNWIFYKRKNLILFCTFGCIIYSLNLLFAFSYQASDMKFQTIHGIGREPEPSRVENKVRTDIIHIEQKFPAFGIETYDQELIEHYGFVTRNVRDFPEYKIERFQLEIENRSEILKPNEYNNNNKAFDDIEHKTEPAESEIDNNYPENVSNAPFEAQSDYKTETNDSDNKNAGVSTKMKYILEWTSTVRTPFHVLKQNRAVFIANRCKFTNCFITNDRDYLSDESKFDAIMFASSGVKLLTKRNLPTSRSSKQKYVFVSTEPAPKNVVLSSRFDNFFNWTWTYRLDSDIVWKHFTVYDLRNKALGPSKHMNWPEQLKPISEKLKKKLKSKTRIAAWFVSNCDHSRVRFADKVYSELRKYGWKVDVYGKCGNLKCGSFKDPETCFKLLEIYYYFYLAFENSFDDDYVTEKVLTALNNFVVPVVYGGANYSRFLPPGSYLDARILGPENLAKTMNDIINNSTLYHDFFRWRNHFRFKSTWSNQEVCNICTALNDEALVKKTTVYKDFKSWWNYRLKAIYEMIKAYHEQRTHEKNLTWLKFDGLSVTANITDI